MRHRLEETKDIVLTLAALLRDARAKHVFLVRGHRSFEECGAKYALDKIMNKWPLEQLTEFFDFSVNPKEEEAQIGVQLLLDAKPDVIIAIGGGSVMDMAKLIRHYAAEQKYPMPLWAIPTTAGTGAEATHFAVVYKDGVKHSIEAEDIWPDVAILYAPFTYKNDAYLTACTGFDALAQAIEAFWNPKATDESEVYALRAISYIHSALPKCIENPSDTRLRDYLLSGSYWAGRAINITKTTAPHAFSYAFTTHCGYPHGHAVAITFPFFAALNVKNDIKSDELRWELGLNKETDIKQNFMDYINRIGLKYEGTRGKDLHELLSLVNMDRLKNNPVAMSPERMNELENFIKSLG